MASDTGTILNHYNITSPFPTEWPAEKDESDASDTEIPIKATTISHIRRSKSRYSVLERSGSDRRSLVPGSEKTRDGVENLVQKDEADPLGASNSVVRVLRDKGLPVDEDQRLREHLDTPSLPKLR
jgi:exocyst complex component 2